MPVDIGARIKAARLRKDMTQEDLARLTGTTKQNIYKYENGIITNIPLDRVESIAAALSIDPADLLGWTDEHPQDDPWDLRERLRRDPDMRILFDAASKASPEHLRAAAAMLKALEPEERDVE